MVDDLDWLIEAIRTSETCLAGTVWYIFGSLLRNKKANADIDLLVLYDREEQVDQIRASLKARLLERPVDVLFMSFIEESELDFVRSEGCVEVFPRCRLGQSTSQ